VRYCGVQTRSAADLGIGLDPRRRPAARPRATPRRTKRDRGSRSESVGRTDGSAVRHVPRRRARWIPSLSTRLPNDGASSGSVTRALGDPGPPVAAAARHGPEFGSESGLVLLL